VPSICGLKNPHAVVTRASLNIEAASVAVEWLASNLASSSGNPEFRLWPGNRMH
jgi:hypothetical protein